ncbi:schlafen family member 8-like isoform X2 [Haliotis rufescens]|nr:schlafen family member 8-like isoform X2 [Haliotis rufescens]XP_048249350.1 schlafen family member 8-like isoform X2 [Haliotis rufescens]
MNNVLTSQDVTAMLDRYGETVLHCSVHISRRIHEHGNHIVMHFACALLNSAGGLLHMKNLDHDRHIQPKDLDTWWGGMESNIADILSGDDICNYFDLIGNYDDKDLYLFVKAAEHLCTIDYHCRLPTDTATHEVSYRSALKILTNTGEVGYLKTLPPIPRSFQWKKTEDTLKQEGKQIQFKMLTSGRDSHAKSMPDKIRYYCTKYISAFANHQGGHIYFGIEDTSAAVLGEAMTEEEQDKTVEKINNKMKSVIWGDEGFVAERGRHWDITFHNILGCSARERRVVVVISVCRFPGGVFTSCPESYYLDKSGQVKAFTYTQWKLAVLNQVRDKLELHSRFMKLPLLTPGSRLVFGLPHTIPRIKEKVLNLRTGSNLYPKHFLNTVGSPGIKTAIKDILAMFAAEPHLALALHTFGIGSVPEFKSDFVADILVLSHTHGLHLLCLAEDLPRDKSCYFHRCQQVAESLKKKLVHNGGCTERFGICVHVVDIEDPLFVQEIRMDLETSWYPSTFHANTGKLDHILTSLIIAMATYKPHEAGTEQEEYYFLLTCDQFELLCQHQFTRELWVHGPPGAGKTVVALQMIRELCRRGCTYRNILYIAENELLCSYVRSFELCDVVTRRDLMQTAQDPDNFRLRFFSVLNVVVDEAQNFKDRDGDWYSLAQSLANGNFRDKLDQTEGYFWVFMDYAQKVHKFKAGLPGLIGKNNYMLSEISRNSKEIFEYASKFMRLNESNEDDSYMKDSPRLGHSDTSGPGVSIIKCEKSSVEDTLMKVIRTCAEDGVKLEDMAVLLGKKMDAEKVEGHFKDKLEDMVRQVEREKGAEVDLEKEGIREVGTTDADDCVKDELGKGFGRGMIVDTVRRFSGLDKPIVIGLDPRINEEHADINKFIVNLATRAKQGLVIITTSDEVMKKLNA